MRNNWMEKQWRVHIHPDGGKGANLMPFSFEREIVIFESPNDLPQWVKERIAVLNVIGGTKYVEGIGQRFIGTKDIYWVDEPTGIANELGYNLTEENGYDGTST